MLEEREMNESVEARDDDWWQGVQQKNTALNGAFFFGVLTTGVFCRPSCPARTPLRKNVRFFRTAEEAQNEGLRPCLRCHPLTESVRRPHAGQMKRLCRYIREHADQSLTLETLAQEANMSPHHLQKTFHTAMGVTPKEYADACRLQRLRGSLRTRSSVTEAIVEAGYGSSSRVYEKIDTRLGMTPGEYRSGGSHVAISYAGSMTALGTVLIGATDRGICFLQFGDSEDGLLEQLKREYPKAIIAPMNGAQQGDFAAWMQVLSNYLAGEVSRLGELPLDSAGTAFQYKVWRYLQQIPAGEVRSYTEVAEGIGQPTAVRAVASACAANRVALAIPCHRVIRGNGELGGFRWGLERKRTLLDQERRTRLSGKTPV